MLDQLFNIVKQFGQDTVVNNPEVPNEYNQDVMADATHTIAGGFQNVLAGGGFQSILDLFKGGGSGGGLAGLVKNPMVSMMIGHFISKLVGKYNMSPSSASSIANNLIPNSINQLVEQTNDPGNEKATMDGFIGSLVGKAGVAVSEDNTQNASSSPLQDLLDQFTGGNSGNKGSGGFDLQNIISNLTNKAQDSFQKPGGGEAGNGLMDLIKGFIS